MADVGRSTAAHAEGNVESHAIVARLENWGAWQRSLPADGPGLYPAQPMFRDVVDRYRETFAKDPYNATDAEELEAHISNNLSIRHMLCLQMRFILKLSSRRAAGLMSRQGHPCSHPTYLNWLDDAIDNLIINA